MGERQSARRQTCPPRGVSGSARVDKEPAWIQPHGLGMGSRGVSEATTKRPTMLHDVFPPCCCCISSACGFGARLQFLALGFCY